jgi:PAS domain S-box-containing protein
VAALKSASPEAAVENTAVSLEGALVDPESTAELAHLVSPLRAGWFNFYFADDRWEWSPEVAQIHGYEPGTVTPTTDLVMRHKHPDDHPKVAAVLDHVRRTQQTISTRHRIVDTKGHTREVIVLGEQLRDDTGAKVGTHGFYIDVTPTQLDGVDGTQLDGVDVTTTQLDGSVPDPVYAKLVSDAVTEMAQSRGPIEQVKGVLMFVYRIDEQRAFGLLKWRSQETNVKLRALAVQLAADILDLDYDDNLPRRSSLDRLLMTAHLRVASSEVAS